LSAFDLVILGSGSTAFSAAIRAARLGKTVAMTEARTLGGTCVNRGCLPSKNLLAAAALYWESRQPRFPGLTPGDMRLDFAELVRQKDALIEDYRGRKYRGILDDRVEIFDGSARFVAGHAVAVGGRVVEAPRGWRPTATAGSSWTPRSKRPPRMSTPPAT
jgi:mercuric reductase